VAAAARIHGGGAKAPGHCGCCEGIGKRATECSASYIYAVDTPRKERGRSRGIRAASRKVSGSVLSIAREMMATVADTSCPSSRE
jgi:hypothetical protein